MLDLFLLMFQNVKKKKLWNLKLRTNLGLAEENGEGEIFSLPFIYMKTVEEALAVCRSFLDGVIIFPTQLSYTWYIQYN